MPEDASSKKSPDVPEEPSGAPSTASEVQYTIDELAATTGVPSRTIRFYQAKGALLPPIRRGRVAYYDESHAERLRLVAHLQDRGLSLRAIRDLFVRTEGGDVSVSEWLGVGEQLRVPWTDDRPIVATEEELVARLGPAFRPGLVSDLIRAGIIRREPTAPGSYFIGSPGILQIGLLLEAAGVEFDSAKLAHDILRKHLSRAAEELVEHFTRRVREVSEIGGPEQIGRALEALRSTGGEAVRLVFAQEIERALREALEEGRAMPPQRKKKH